MIPFREGSVKRSASLGVQLTKIVSVTASLRLCRRQNSISVTASLRLCRRAGSISGKIWELRRSRSVTESMTLAAEGGLSVTCMARTLRKLPGS